MFTSFLKLSFTAGLLLAQPLTAMAPAGPGDVSYTWSADQPPRLLAHRRPDSRAFVVPGSPWLGRPPEGVSRDRWYAYDGWIVEAAAGYGLDPALLKALMWCESRGFQHARSPAGAEGPFQLMPGTQRTLGVDDPYDGHQAAWGCAAHLRRTADLFSTMNMLILVGGYNAGDVAVQRQLAKVKARHGSLRDPWAAVPQFPETREHVSSVLAVWDSIHRGRSCPTLRRW